MDQYFETLQNLFMRYGNLIVFPILFLEVIPFLGFIAPAITLLIFIGFILAPSPVKLISTTLVAFVAMLIADSLMFFLGRYSGGKWKALKSVNSRANTALEVISKQPVWLMIFYQFPPYFRMFLPYGLGMSKFSTRTWIPITFIGSAIYVVTFIGVGYVSYSLFNSITAAEDLGEGLTYFITVYAVMYFIVLVYQYIQKRKKISSEKTQKEMDPGH